MLLCLGTLILGGYVGGTTPQGKEEIASHLPMEECAEIASSTLKV